MLLLVVVLVVVQSQFTIDIKSPTTIILPKKGSNFLLEVTIRANEGWGDWSEPIQAESLYLCVYHYLYHWGL